MSTSRRLATRLAAVLLAAAGCASDDPAAPSAIEGLGSLAGRWDGKEWRGYGYAVLQRDTLFLVGHRPDPQYFYDERVRARVPFRGAGTYELAVKDASLEQITGGDAGYFPGATGELQLTQYDATAARVRGTLRLTAAEHGFAWRFEQGSFGGGLHALGGRAADQEAVTEPGARVASISRPSRPPSASAPRSPCPRARCGPPPPSRPRRGRGR
jgi:hypothetical protein